MSTNPPSSSEERRSSDSSNERDASCYNQNNGSTSSLHKKKKGFGSKIIEIGKPTEFEHGIHVEYNTESGKFLVSCLNFLKIL